MKIVGLTSSTVRLSLGLGVWGAATWSVLSLHDAPIIQTHSICGPWGCGPTIPALLAAHGFWLLVIIPAAFCGSYLLTKCRSMILGRICLGLGIGGMVAIALAELMHRPYSAPPGAETYPIQRVLFALATTVDAPLLPTVIAGLILMNAGRHPKRSHETIESDSSEDPNVARDPGLAHSSGFLGADSQETRIELGEWPSP